MEKYIGTKVIQAAPAWKVTVPDGRTFVQLKSDNAPFSGVAEDGYAVRYQDNYESWSPRAVFEAAYRPTDCLNFGLALEAAKMDMKIARKGWNGKGMYVFLADIGEIFTDADLSEFDDRSFSVGECLIMRTADGNLQPGWLASQADMLADDWIIVE